MGISAHPAFESLLGKEDDRSVEALREQLLGDPTTSEPVPVSRWGTPGGLVTQEMLRSLPVHGTVSEKIGRTMRVDMSLGNDTPDWWVGTPERGSTPGAIRITWQRVRVVG